MFQSKFIEQLICTFCVSCCFFFIAQKQLQMQVQKVNDLKELRIKLPLRPMEQQLAPCELAQRDSCMAYKKKVRGFFFVRVLVHFLRLHCELSFLAWS